jgi:hypothetical protein
MLCPNVMDVGDIFVEAYSNIRKVDSFAYAGRNIMVGKLAPDPDWLGPVRTRVSLLSDSCAQWQQKKPDIWSQILMPFTNYYTLFSGFTEAAKGFGEHKQIWLQALDNLKEGLTTAKEAVKTAELQFETQINNLKNVEELLKSSINDAWAALESEEKEMVKLASEITHLQDQVDHLQSDITSAEFSAGKNYIQSTVTISYALVSSAGADIPYLSIAGLLFTIGKMAYDLIVTDKEISQTIDRIFDLRLKATEEAQAAAVTKAIIHLITNLNSSITAIKNTMPRFDTMWSNEREKIQQAINAINSGVEPAYYIDLHSMPAALATWETLAGYVQKLTQPPEQGKPVELSILKNKKGE